MEGILHRHPLRLENPLWDYACARYANPELRDLCLHLQETRGADVNLVLAAGWAAQKGHCMETARLHSQVADWRHHIILPIRQCRQSLNKQHCQERRLRNLALKLEIRAEQVELALIFFLLDQEINAAQKAPQGIPEKSQDIITICNQNLLDTLTCEGHAHPVVDGEIERLSFLLITGKLSS
ncbi:TIGR02444 family protein [Hahella sp. CCB-MM4]|uniref:TIGR02444 family protein n=1 Tax=Hahella sp. (strain CCB-MM4) TaxID=1926491 RepID=UPI000B9BCC4F|nr:TIGR02444 family protein [Hahella sp. CCB-MM4]OZG74645.1 TIGR02444 family protein [Hahella sp. CCB-MM4]